MFLPKVLRSPAVDAVPDRLVDQAIQHFVFSSIRFVVVHRSADKVTKASRITTKVSGAAFFAASVSTAELG